jgi:peptidoglycan endopeptidase LytE
LEFVRGCPEKSLKLTWIKWIMAVAFLFVMALLVCFWALAAEASQTTVPYVVKSGDNLWAIARQHNTTVNAIMQASGLRSDNLFIGQRLAIPAKPTTGDAGLLLSVPPPEILPTGSTPGLESGGHIEYIVCAGDTLWSIAVRHGVSINEIRSLNVLSGNMLKIGQKLLLPNGARVTARPDPDLQGTEVSRSGDRIQTILNYARTLLGTPYRMGGGSPGGFDCSGFVSHVFGYFGIRLPRASDAQFKVGTPVESGDLCLGDLVFFTTYAPGPSHVGIYVGNNQFIHSSSPRSGGVIFTPMNDSYYAARYLGARRVLP